MARPLKKKSPYDQKRLGYAGKFGSGANVDIMYLQTAFTPSNLRHVDLIEEIPGSERWDIRDLFQRHVNKRRVADLKKYLLAEDSVKFFNPITLILLPYDQHTHRIVADVRYLEPQQGSEQEAAFSLFENTGYYQLKYFDDPEYSELTWSQEKTRLVAIDGQHRLSALKQIEADPKLSQKIGSNWSVPAVILVMSKVSSEAEAPSLLEVVRKTFININQEAAQINRARLIILDDESVNRICCQEIVNASHKNDQNESEGSVISSRTPLMFFDWRGEVEGNREKPVEGSILSMVELEGLFEFFVLGEDGSAEQQAALELDDMIPALETFGKDQKLSHDEANRIREKFRGHLMPAVQHLLENLRPFEEYISQVRRIQFPAEYSDLASKAFKQICFGSPPVMNETEYQAVNSKVQEMIQDFAIAKNNTFDALLQRDIGLRAIFVAFAQLKPIYDEENQETAGWLEYAKWFVPKINCLIDQGWFNGFHEDRAEVVTKFTEHTVFKPSGDIDNYKFKDVGDAFGPVIGLQASNNESETFRQNYWEFVEGRLRRVLLKGYKAKVRSDLQSEPMTIVERNKKVNERANQLMDMRLAFMKSGYLNH